MPRFLYIMLSCSDFDVFVFDLDDTLYSEKTYVHSGYRYLSSLLLGTYGVDTEREFIDCWSRGESDVLDYIIRTFNLPSFLKQHLIFAYRYHRPEISLHVGAREVLNSLRALNVPMYLITDGRSVTQRLKLQALGLRGYFRDIFISEEIGAEKPSLKAFQTIMQSEGDVNFVYVADNPNKDFLAPRQLGWYSLGVLHEESRVHKLLDGFEQKADCWIDSLEELTI